MKYAPPCIKSTSKNNFGLASFGFAAVGFVLIILAFVNIKGPSYQIFTEAAFALLVASIVTGAIAKRKGKARQGP